MRLVKEIEPIKLKGLDCYDRSLVSILNFYGLDYVKALFEPVHFTFDSHDGGLCISESLGFGKYTVEENIIQAFDAGIIKNEEPEFCSPDYIKTVVIDQNIPLILRLNSRDCPWVDNTPSEYRYVLCVNADAVNLTVYDPYEKEYMKLIPIIHVPDLVKQTISVSLTRTEISDEKAIRLSLDKETFDKNILYINKFNEDIKTRRSIDIEYRNMDKNNRLSMMDQLLDVKIAGLRNTYSLFLRHVNLIRASEFIYKSMNLWCILRTTLYRSYLTRSFNEMKDKITDIIKSVLELENNAALLLKEYK